MIRRWLFRRFWRIFFTVLVIWGVVVGGLVLGVHNYGQMAQPQPADVIIVLGAGIRRDGRAGDALYRRSIWAAQAWRDGLAPHLICTGGQSENRTRSEASACRDVLMAAGVDQAAIFLDEKARSTEENAIYSREIMDAQGWEHAILVTDSYHMLRANWIFSNYGLQPFPYPVPAEQLRARIYVWSLGREIVALHWEAFKQVFNLPFTYVSFG